MTKTFLWQFSPGRLSDASLFPCEWICPKNELHINDPADLIGQRVVLFISEGKDAYLFGIIVVEAVAAILDGKWKNDIIIYSNKTQSLKILPNDANERFRWKFNKSNLEDGICEANKGITTELQAIFDKNKTHSLAPKKIKPELSSLLLEPKEVNHLAKVSYELALREFPYGELELQSKKNPLTSYALFAIEFLESQGFDQSMINFIVTDLDSKLKDTFDFRQVSIHPEARKDVSSKELRVDLTFVEINPDNIFSRKFFTLKGSIDLSFLKDKTEVAEERHQAILKDLVTYLKKIGLSPSETQSIDLAIKFQSNHICLVEIKTSNDLNFLRQGEHALIQLLRYKLAIRKAGWNSINCAIVIEINKNSSLQCELEALAKEIGIQIFYYDKELDWPNRVSGLDIYLQRND
jgi:hypothetical protein